MSTSVTQYESQVYELTATGGRMSVQAPFELYQWQLQHRDGSPMLMLEHYGEIAGRTLYLPRMPAGTQFRVAFVQVSYGRTSS